MVARDKENLSGQQIGNYEIESHIAARKASDLFLARDVKLERLVFLEVLRTTADEDENLTARFRRRMETVSQLKDPAIAVVSDLDTTDDGFPYAVIDYFPGTTLAEKLADLSHSQPMPVIEALELTKQIAHALGVAHTAGLIHHDLRPENVMLREDGAPVLIDLGLPVVLDPAAPGVNGAESEMLDYASPEELEGKQLTRRSNIYSLGIILYELLSGHRPKLPVLPFDIFPQANMPKEEPLEEARPGLAGETYRLVRNCLWRQEWSRFETADEMITAIETAIFAEQELPKAAGWGAPQRNRRFVYIIPAALLVLALLGFLALRNARGGRAEAAEETPAAENTPSDVISGPTEAGPTAAPTATLTVELPTEPPSGSSMVTVLSPGPGREFTLQDTITFDWYWPTLPEPGQHFAVYLIDGETEYQLGALTEPNNGISYRLAVPGDEIPTTGEELTWQVRLESIDGGDVQVASDLVPIVILAAAPTATGTPEPGTPTATVTAEACVVSPPPGWVVYNVRAGDALSDLAERANLEVETLIEINCLTTHLLSVGQPLWVPLSVVPRTPTPPPVAPTNPPPAPTVGFTPGPVQPSPTQQVLPTETTAPNPPTETPGTDPPTSTPPPDPTEPSQPPP
jgi:serine/threonine protein kinase/LysM repeat protein